MKKDTIKVVLVTIGTIVLTIVMAYSFTNGFTVTLDEAFGVSNKSGTQSFLIGELNVKNAIISIVIIAVFFVFLVLRKNRKRHE